MCVNVNIREEDSLRKMLDFAKTIHDKEDNITSKIDSGYIPEIMKTKRHKYLSKAIRKYKRTEDKIWHLECSKADNSKKIAKIKKKRISYEEYQALRDELYDIKTSKDTLRVTRKRLYKFDYTPSKRRKDKRKKSYFGYNDQFPGWKRGRRYKLEFESLPLHLSNWSEDFSVKIDKDKVLLPRENTDELANLEVINSNATLPYRAKKKLETFIKSCEKHFARSDRWEKYTQYNKDERKLAAKGFELLGGYNISSSNGYYGYRKVEDLLNTEPNNLIIDNSKHRASFKFSKENRIVELLIPVGANEIKNTSLYYHDNQVAVNEVIYPYKPWMQKIRKFFGLNPLYSGDTIKTK